MSFSLFFSLPPCAITGALYTFVIVSTEDKLRQAKARIRAGQICVSKKNLFPIDFFYKQKNASVFVVGGFNLQVQHPQS
jgi:hypothetical protein